MRIIAIVCLTGGEGEVAHTAAICPPKYPRTCPTTCNAMVMGLAQEKKNSQFQKPQRHPPPPFHSLHVLGIFEHRFCPIFGVLATPSADVAQHQMLPVSAQKDPGALRVCGGGVCVVVVCCCCIDVRVWWWCGWYCGGGGSSVVGVM